LARTVSSGGYQALRGMARSIVKDAPRTIKSTARKSEEYTRGMFTHVVTQKGKGYEPAENSADKYHGVSKFNIVTGVQSKSTPNAPSYTNVFADALIKEAQTFDVGIAEQHAVTFAGGLAADGYKPFCAIYSTFLQRGYDQLVHDVCIQNLPVRFAMDRAGLVGADGPTHVRSCHMVRVLVNVSWRQSN